MKKQLLNILACPACTHPLKFSVGKENTVEILSGQLTCDSCRRTFSIKAGIPDLLHEPSSIVKDEITGNQKMHQQERKDFNDDWLLSLPDGFKPKGQRIRINTDESLEKLNLTGEETVLEIGAGTTWLSRIIAERYGCNVVATDILRETFIGLESARIYMDNLDIYYERVLCQMEKLPFVDKSFDVVLAYASIHHTENLFETIRQASRVLKTGGRLVLLHEGVSGILRNNRILGYSYENNNPYDWNEHTYWAGTYLDTARKCGLKPDVFWPAFLSNLTKLSKDNFNGESMQFGKLGKCLMPFYKNRLTKSLIVNRFSLRLALLILGIPLNMVAIKVGDK